MKTLLSVCMLITVIPTFAQKTQTSINMPALVDSVGKALNDTYIFPDKSRVMIEYLRKQLKAGRYKDIKDPIKIASALETDLKTAHRDDHLRVHYDPEFLKRAKAIDVPPDTMRKREVIDGRKDNFNFKQSIILNGNIGYVEFTGFNPMIEEAKPIISAAFRFVSNTDAVIVDLRSNGGGSPFMVRQIASYFVSERTRLNDIYDRRANKTMEFWADPADAENMNLSMPLYIITSKGTFSGAEDFTYAMQVNKRAIVVGETTGGGAHPTGPVWVGLGYVIDIPFARSINYITKTDWEGTGVTPDVSVSQEKALVKAQELILNERIKTANDDHARSQAQWLVDALHAHDYNASITEKDLAPCVGDYDRFKIRLTSGKLYLHDHLGRTFLMMPVDTNHFLASDWLQVKFNIKDGIGSQMVLSGKPGWVDVYDRNK
ncbi:S41 family peptidase [Chryseolinea sp. T2]|uniref:S41 family peptidase n=1 Tax=Chryseolinea sp. T2 TaxID=3129255 RepID=UPI003077734F